MKTTKTKESLSLNPTIVINISDLKDLNKLAFVKAIIGTKCGYFKKLRGYDELADMFIISDAGTKFVGYDNQLKFKYSDIKLEPRLAMNEDFLVSFDYENCVGDEVIVNTSGDTKFTEYNYEAWLNIGLGEIKPSLNWIEENFEVFDEV
jgi:hypothetical protein